MISQLVEKLKRLSGIDRPVLSILINNIFNVAKGFVTILLIIKFLGQTEQGYWYTFGSLGALSVFAELGFTVIMTQFVSHEFAKLSFTPDGVPDGAEGDLDRFYSLIKYAIRLYLVMIPLAFLILTMVGIVFFSGESYAGLIPAWFAYSLSGAITLVVSLFQSIYQGCDRVYEVQKNVLINSVLTTLLSWIFLMAGLGIWSLVLSSLLSVSVTAFLLYRAAPQLWAGVANHRKLGDFEWFKTMVPLQWKYAISWIAGYFIFRLFVPVVFKIEGARIAGQIGITLILVGAVNSAAHSWGESMLPRINMAVARGELQELKRLFRQATIRGSAFYCTAAVAVMVAIIAISEFPFIATRLAPPVVCAWLLVAYLAMFLVSSLATVLRAHKEEPFYILSIVNAAAMAMMVLFAETRYGIHGMSVGVAAVEWLLVVPYAWRIYRKSMKRHMVTHYRKQGRLKC